MINLPQLYFPFEINRREHLSDGFDPRRKLHKMTRKKKRTYDLTRIPSIEETIVYSRSTSGGDGDVGVDNIGFATSISDDSGVGMNYRRMMSANPIDVVENGIMCPDVIIVALERVREEEEKQRRNDGATSDDNP